MMFFFRLEIATSAFLLKIRGTVAKFHGLNTHVPSCGQIRDVMGQVLTVVSKGDGKETSVG
jgi:hypothetical protein